MVERCASVLERGKGQAKMKFLTFALLLVVAGASAYPQTEVDAFQGRIYDLWVQDWIDRLIKYILKRGWDPMAKDEYDFDIVIISRLAEARGTVRNVEVSGASQLVCEKLSYNFLLGRLDWDCVHRGVRASLGSADIELIYGDRRGKGTASGSIEIRDIRLKGNALLKHDGSGQPWIYNMNAKLNVGRIESDMKIVGNGVDYSERANTFLNVKVPEMLVTNENEINTLVGEGLRYLVEWLRGRD